MNYTIYKQAKNQSPKLSIVLSVYNKETWLPKTITSLIEQTCDPTEFEIVFVDDASTDNSYSLLKEFANQYDHVTLVQCEKNSGTPAYPRNLGIELARGTWCMIMDADDWLEVTAVEDILAIAEESKDDVIIGRVIRHIMDKKKEEIISPYITYQEQRNITLEDFPYLVFNLSPCGKVFKKELVVNHQLQFPAMIYSEDKWFYFYLLSYAKGISITKTVLYHVNRSLENISLVRGTSIFEKMDTNFVVLEKILSDESLSKINKKAMCIRLLNFDCITRLFNRKHFLEYENKKEYFEYFEKTIQLFNKYNYPIDEDFMIVPENNIIFQLATQHRYEDLTLFIRWIKNTKDKLMSIVYGQNDNPDTAKYQLPVKDVEDYFIPCLASLNYVDKSMDTIKVSTQLFMSPNTDVQLVIQERTNVNNFITVSPIHIQKNTYEFYIPRQQLELVLGNNKCEIFLSFLGTRKSHITAVNVITNDQRFYSTIKNNLGFDGSR